MMRVSACALYDGDYHIGAAVLANSMIASGFAGTLWIGHRGEPPAWATPLVDHGKWRSYAATGDVELRFVPIDHATLHTAWAKPHFMLRILDELDPGIDAVVYFDVDIVTISPWSFFQDWLENGVGLCTDIGFPMMAASHPFRRHWRALAKDAVGRDCRPLDLYFNSGFAAVPRAHRDFLEVWRAVTDLYAGRHPDAPRALRIEAREHPFFSTDQDFMNVAAMASDVPLSILGQEGMEFLDTSYGMSHSAQAPKPWHASYLLRALDGSTPGRHQRWWKHADGPIRAFSSGRLMWARISLRLAAMVGRFYRRR